MKSKCQTVKIKPEYDYFSVTTGVGFIPQDPPNLVGMPTFAHKSPLRHGEKIYLSMKSKSQMIE